MLIDIVPNFKAHFDVELVMQGAKLKDVIVKLKQDVTTLSWAVFPGRIWNSVWTTSRVFGAFDNVIEIRPVDFKLVILINL